MFFTSKVTGFRLKPASSTEDSTSSSKLMRKAQAIKIASNTPATMGASLPEEVSAVAGAAAVSKDDGQVVQRLGDYSSELEGALAESSKVEEIVLSDSSISSDNQDGYESDSSEYSIASSGYDYSGTDLSDTEETSLKFAEPSTFKPKAERSKISFARSLDVGHAFDKQSMLYSDALQKTADRYNAVISVRLPSRLGQSYIEDNYPTKNFHVKAKSSDKGPTAGLIAYEAFLSKRPPDQYEKQSEDIAKAIKQGAKAVDLVITEKKIASLLKESLMQRLPNGDYKATFYGQERLFIIDTSGKVFHKGGDLDGQPVKVLTNPPEKKTKRSALPMPADNLPITADYDLFAIVPHKNQADNPRPLKLGQRSIFKGKSSDGTVFPEKLRRDYGTMRKSTAFREGLATLTKVKGKFEEMDADQGNFHIFGMAIAKSINRFAEKQGYSGGKLVWHGDEAGNPFGPGFVPEDAPIFFIPGHAPLQIKSREELLELHKKLVDLDYKPEDVAW